MRASLFLLLAAVLFGVISESAWSIPLIVIFGVLAIRDIWFASEQPVKAQTVSDTDEEPDSQAARVAQIRRALHN